MFHGVNPAKKDNKKMIFWSWAKNSIGWGARSAELSRRTGSRLDIDIAPYQKLRLDLGNAALINQGREFNPILLAASASL
jgi:hypothetical protein